jgi:hypothetical protein
MVVLVSVIGVVPGMMVTVWITLVSLVITVEVVNENGTVGTVVRTGTHSWCVVTNGITVTGIKLFGTLGEITVWIDGL